MHRSTLLHTAINYLDDSTEILSLLLKEGADIFATDKNGLYPFHLGCIMGNTEGVRILIEFGKKIDYFPIDIRSETIEG